MVQRFFTINTRSFYTKRIFRKGVSISSIKMKCLWILFGS